MTKVRTCPGCADKVSAGDAFCERCGHPLPEDVRQAPAENPDTVPTGPNPAVPGLVPADGGPTAPQVSLYGADRYEGSGATYPGPTGSGATASGSTGPGSTHSGPTYPGPTASGATPSGSTRPGSTPSGSTPSGSTRPGSIPSAPTPSGSTYPGSTPSGSTAREEPNPQGVYRTVNPADVTVAGIIPSDATPSGGTRPAGTPPAGPAAPAGPPSGAAAPSGAPVPGAPPTDSPRGPGRARTDSLAVDDDWDAIDSLATQPVRRDPQPPGPAPERVAPDWPPPTGSEPVQPTNPDLCVWCPGRVVDGYCEQCGFLQPTGRDHVEVRTRTVVGVSDRGLRHRRNEDAMAIRVVPDDSPHAAGVVCAVVCDGVSSSPRSDEASRVTAETGVTVLAEQMRRGVDAREATGVAMTRAADAVAAIAESPSSAPACTFVSAVVNPATGTVTVGWVGDSRAYWLSGDPAATVSALLTRDDSWSEAMVQMGALSREEAMRSANAHALIAWMGADSGEIDAHISTVTPTGPGTVLLCSDGLWNYYPEARALTEAVPGAGTRPLEAARTYVRLALEGGGKDNITVVVIPVPAGGPRVEQG
ncbi:PP2C family protein-serine/threonine phosphatase [Nocardiopsis protaetiae]|uniref:PP2C family protein-serine/threonine phosphatase n=1 Tax=Nocardiopsis protaetiae TaxID=3382270 RepID=UPI00387A89D9